MSMDPNDPRYSDTPNVDKYPLEGRRPGEPAGVAVNERRRLTKPAPMHNSLFDGAPAMCGCWSCSRIILSLRCPFAWPEQAVNGVTISAGRCGDYKGHREAHTLLVASSFTDAEEIVRLDAPPETLVTP